MIWPMEAHRTPQGPTKDHRTPAGPVLLFLPKTHPSLFSLAPPNWPCPDFSHKEKLIPLLLSGSSANGAGGGGGDASALRMFFLGVAGSSHQPLSVIVEQDPHLTLGSLAGLAGQDVAHSAVGKVTQPTQEPAAGGGTGGAEGMGGEYVDYRQNGPGGCTGSPSTLQG